MTDADDASLQDFARALVREHEERLGSARAVAKLLVLSEGSLSQFKSGKIGLGLAPMLRLALASGTTIDAMQTRTRSSPPATPDRYPARVKAIARAKEDGRSDRAIQAVATFQGHDADALTVEAWSALIASFEAAFAAGKLGAKKTK